MSVEAITWALKLPMKQSSAKFVLVVLANSANPETLTTHPSVAYLSAATGQDRKTIMANLGKLRTLGLIEDTGKRVGKTKQIIVYRVLCGPDLFAQLSHKRNSSKNGTVPNPEQFQKRKGTVPETGHGDVRANKAKSGVCDAGAHEEGVGSFEGHGSTPPDVPRGTPQGRAAAALNRAGVKVTSMDPDLIAACAEGVTVENLLELADIHDGKPAKYLIATARRLRAEQPSAVQRTGSARRGGAPPRPRANDDTTGARYSGTPDDELPEELRSTG